MLDGTRIWNDERVFAVDRRDWQGMIRKSYSQIDLWKFIFGIAVIMIHTSPYKDCSDTFVWYFSALFTRLAVPFFMITSGFFLGRKIRKKGIGVIKEYGKALLPKFFFWGTLALLMNAVSWYNNCRSIEKTLLLVVKNAFFYPQGAMWFILALIISSSFLEFLLKKKVPILAMGIVATVLFAFALLCNTYFFMVEGTIIETVIKFYLRYCISARNGLFLFLYMYIGYVISSDRIKKFKRSKLIFLVVISYTLLAGEATLLHNVRRLDDSSLFVSYLILIPSFILLLTTIDTPIPHNEDLRNISGIMYYTHPVFVLLLAQIVQKSILQFVIVLTATVAVWIITRHNTNKYVRMFLY